MRHTLKAEFKKLLTVRSTYLTSLLFLLFLGFLSFYGQGIKVTNIDKNWLSGSLLPTASTTSLIAAVISLLLMAHEYRHNTIMYTLTAARSRSYVLISKIIVVLSYTLVLVIAADVISVGLAIAGAKAAGHHIPHQDINYLTSFVKSLVYCEGFSLAALLFVTLIRNLTASLVLLFLFPNTIEALLGLVVKQPQKYLPFAALQQVIGGPHTGIGKAPDVSPVHGAVVFSLYLIVGWIIAWYFFNRRDAN